MGFAGGGGGMSAKHTQGRMQWRGRSDGSLIYIIGDHETGEHAQGDIHISEPNLRRIAACWNACEGIADPENVIPRLLELNEINPALAGQVATFCRQNVELLEALKAVRAWDVSNLVLDVPLEIRRQMLAAIAKAEGGAA